MRAPIRPVATAAASLAIIASLLGAAVVEARPGPAAGAAGSRATRTVQAIGPSVPCTSSGPAVSCEIWAKEGTTTLPGLVAALPVLGYTSTADGTVDRPGGPAIVVDLNSQVTITLHNALTSDATALALPGQALPTDVGTDTTGVASGASGNYSFVASKPGTFLYEAGLTAIGPRQVAMGLYGALIVRPAAGQAYDADSSFDEEFPVVVGGIDPNLNQNPGTFDMGQFAPSYWTLNGRSYPDTAALEVVAPTAPAGTNVLLRYINAGVATDSLGLLGLRERIHGADGAKLPYPYDAVAETIPAGGTLDAVVNVPFGTALGTRYAVGSAAGHMFNGTAAATTGSVSFGGMLTFLTVVASITPGSLDTIGPEIVGTSATRISAAGVYRLTALASDATRGRSAIAGAEWFTGADPGQGNANAFGATDGTFNGISESVAATVDTGTWTPGLHTVSVRARDAAGNWSSVSPVSVTAPDILFRNGFESGTLAGWSAVKNPNRLSVVAAAALNGTRGLRVSLARGTPAYVVDTSPNAQVAYRARFMFHPRTSKTAGAAVDVFVGRTAAGTNIFRIQYRRTTAGRLQLRAVERVGATQRAGAWVTISNRAHTIEISWRAAARGGLTLIVDGRNRGTVAGNTRLLRLDEVRLGASGGVAARVSGRFDIDRFSSSRGGPIVP